MTDESVNIEVQPEQAFCAAHAEPLRAEWPRGYLTCAVLMFTEFASQPDVQSYAQGKQELLAAALMEFGPMCCRMPPELLARIMHVALHPTPGDVTALRDEIVRSHGATPPPAV